MGPGLHGGGALPVDVGDHGALGLRNAGPGAVGDIGRHGLAGHQSRPLPHQHTDQLRAGELSDVVRRAHPGILDKEGLSQLDSLELQALPDGRRAVQGVGRDGVGRESVADDQQHPGIAAADGPDGLLGLGAEPAAQVGPGQIFVLVLAEGLDEGQIVVPAPEEAKKWYLKAAEQGNADAQFCLGRFYTEDSDEDTLSDEAYRWYSEAARGYREAADRGDTEAQYRLGVMYERGWGVQKSEQEALRWYRKAAK